MEEQVIEEVKLLVPSSVAFVVIGVLCIVFNVVAIVFSDPFSIFCHGLICGILVSVGLYMRAQTSCLLGFLHNVPVITKRVGPLQMF